MIDPINYDVAELRTLAGQRDATAFSEATRVEASSFQWGTSPPVRERTHNEMLLSPEHRRRLLLLHDVPFDPTNATPVLSSLSTESTALAFAWLEYLGAVAGTTEARTVLAQYRDAGWLTAPVTEQLHAYLAWLAPREGDGLAAMSQADHLLSFAYVAALAAQQ